MCSLYSLVLVPFLPTLALIAATPACADARVHYSALELEDAVAAAERILDSDPIRPLPCLEVKALALMVLGRAEAEAVLTELFSRRPDYPIEDPSLSPAMVDRIERVRSSVRTLSAELSTRWLTRFSLRLDLVFEGGLHEGHRWRATAVLLPQKERHRVEGPVGQHVGTATIAVRTNEPVERIELVGVVVGKSESVVHQFEMQRSLPHRPEPPALPSVTAAPPTAPATPTVVPAAVPEDSGVHWGVWAVVGGFALVGATVAAILLVQPDLPDTTGTVGRLGVDP